MNIENTDIEYSRSEMGKLTNGVVSYEFLVTMKER